MTEMMNRQESHENREDIASAKKSAAYIMSRRAMSKNELIEKLKQKGFTDECSHETADIFEKLGIINDQDYADMLVRRYLARGYGIYRIKTGFLRHGLDMEIFEKAILEIDGENVREEVDKFINSRLKGKTDRADLKRVSDALYRRGFGWNEINAGIEKYIHNAEALD